MASRVRDKWPGRARWVNADGTLTQSSAQWLSKEFETATDSSAVTDVVTPFALTFLDDADADEVKATLSIGSLASQEFDDVSITGGTISGITDLAVADGGTGASTAAGARTNLGLGSIATQDASAVTITGGSITGITDLAIADGGTGASTASDARTNLGLDLANLVITGGTIDGAPIGQVDADVARFTDLVAVNYVRTVPTTVASLPAASSAGAGARSYVTDATATTFQSIVAGGGANKVPVVSDGTNWLIG